MYNNCVLEARITNDPKLQKTRNDIPYVMLRVACPRNHKTQGEEASDFFSCMVWRGQAEFVAGNFKKGSTILLAGRLENTPKKDDAGNFRDDVILNVSEINFCGYARQTEPGNSDER